MPLQKYWALLKLFFLSRNIPNYDFNPILEHGNNIVQRLSTASAAIDQHLNFLIKKLEPIEKK